MRKLIALITAASFAIGPTLPILGSNEAYAAEDMATSVLNNINTGLQGAQSAIYQFGATQAQLGMMVQSAQGLQQQNGIVNQNMGLLQQVQGQLSMAFAEADQCMKKGQSSGDKRFAKVMGKDEQETEKNLKKLNISMTPAMIEAAEPSCVNYDAIEKSVDFGIDSINKTNTRLKCVQNLQNKIDTIVEAAKQPFTLLSNAANEAAGIRDQIIKQYEETEKKISADLDGENGYKAQLSKLKETSAKLMAALDGGATRESAGGLARRADRLKELRKSTANAWLNNIVSGSINCFQSEPKPCGSSTISPMACVMEQANQDTRGSGIKSAVNTRNAKALNQSFRAAATKAFSSLRAAKRDNLDVNNMEDFLKSSREIYAEISKNMSSTIKKYPLVGGVDESTVSAFFVEQMQGCYEDQIRDMENDLKTSGGGLYYKGYDQVRQEEANIKLEAASIVRSVTDQMNEFRTAFTKTYQNDLPQFSMQCESSDPYAAVDCLKKISSTLRDGINGTGPEGITTLSVPVMQLDPQGRPTAGTSQIQCRGFNECLNFLEKTRDHNRSQAVSQKQEKEKFVQEHNKTINLTMGAIAAQFGAIATLVGPAVQQLNGELAFLGVTNGLKTKTVKGESLELDDKTGLYKTPSSMKKAMANNTAYLELENISEVQKDLQKQRTALLKKKREAAKIKGECEISKDDYKAISNKLENSCKNTCRNLPSIIGSVEFLVEKSGKTPKSERGSRFFGNSSISKDFARCWTNAASKQRAAKRIERLKSKENSKSDEITIETSLAEWEKDASTPQACAEEAKSSLDAKNDESRTEKFKNDHSDLIDHLNAITMSCADNTADSLKEAESACNTLKNSVDSLKPAAEKEEGGDSDRGIAPIK